MIERYRRSNHCLFWGERLDSVIIHKGTFSPDMSTFYLTISDRQFARFDILITELVDDVWSTPVSAFFNSNYSDHGMSFSPDGQTIWFSSTRPVPDIQVADTWHIWKVVKRQNGWSIPTYVDIPNLRQKLASHPSIANDGTLYFHSSELDYSDMKLYKASTQSDGRYKDATALDLPYGGGACTPYIDPDQRYILYADIGSSLDLHISYRGDNGQWSLPTRLSNKVNTGGQGNPSITPDISYMIYTAESDQTENNWDIMWVDAQPILSH